MSFPYLIFTALISSLTGALVAPPPPTDLRCFKSTNLTGACIRLNISTCMGGSLSFKSTSLSLARDSSNLSEVYAKLQQWSGLRKVPQCWSVIQPFLCSVYLPRCDDTIGVELPSRELCERVRKPCHIVEEFKGWPSFLKCDDPHFVSGCKTDTYDKLVFNTSGDCEHPLVRTDDPDSWYQGVEGCGIPCDSPLYSAEDHQEVHIFVAVFGSICLLCTLFTVLTFIIDWQNANRYPAIILFFINTCFFLGSVGWMAQFAGEDARKDIVCRRDGTVRKGEPRLGSNESISCTMVFVVVYYFLVAGMSWFVMLAYAWYLTFVALGTPRDGLTSKTAYFHLVSWCSPLVLTIICLAISEVDGDSVSGICFVGGMNHGVRAVFVLVPVGLVVLVGTFFLIKGVYTLIQIRQEAPVFIPEKTFSKIRDTIIRLGIFTTMALVFVLITFAVHLYIFAYEETWRRSFREYMYCVANASVTSQDVGSTNGGHCELAERPSLIAMEIHIFAFFGAGIAMSSWSWTKSSLSAWERFFRWIFHKPSNKPVRLKRHRMIAQAFEKRKEINQGRVSISYRSSHDDPLGMKFDLNSCSDDDLSSTFAMAMPKLVRRRGGLIYPSPGIGRRYSDSDVQSVISTRRVSRESQFLEFRESQFVVFDRDQLPYDPYGKKSRKKLKKKRGKLNRIKPVLGPMFGGPGIKTNGSWIEQHLHRHVRRKESDSSAISQMSMRGRRQMAKMFKCNSVETISLESNNDGPPDTILPAVTKSSHSNSLDQDASHRSHQLRKEFSSQGDRGGGGLVGGIGSATSGMQEPLSLPGAVPDEENEENSHVTENEVMSHSSYFLRGNDNQRKKQSSESQQQFNKQRARRQSVAVGMPDIHDQNGAISGNGSSANGNSFRPSHQKSQHRCVKTTASATTLTTRKTKTTMLDNVDLSAIPFSPLMADIGGGNWGILLGKSGSSSGSDAGMGCGYWSGGGGSFYRPITHNLTSHNYHHPYRHQKHSGGSGMGMRMSGFHDPSPHVHPHHHPHPHASTNHGPDVLNCFPFNNADSNINMGQGHNYPNAMYNSAYNVGSGPMDVMGGMGIEGGGGYAMSCDIGGGKIYGNNVIGEVQSYNGGNDSHHQHHQYGGNSSVIQGGARPKVPKMIKENLGHFPAHAFYNAFPHDNNRHNINSTARRNGHRSRHLQTGSIASNGRPQLQPQRTMKVPDHTFFNSTFEVDDDVESISA